MTQTATADFTARNPEANPPTATQDTRSAFREAVYSSDLSSVFFNLSEFAEAAMIYHSVIGAWRSYSVLFDDPKTTMRFGGNVEVTELRPQVMIADAMLAAAVSKADRVLVRGVTYLVEDVDADGVGVTTLYLKRR